MNYEGRNGEPERREKGIQAELFADRLCKRVLDLGVSRHRRHAPPFTGFVVKIVIRTVAFVFRPMTSKDSAADTHSTPLRAGSFCHLQQTRRRKSERKRSIYCPLPAALFPSLIASCSVMYLPCFDVP